MKIASASKAYIVGLSLVAAVIIASSVTGLMQIEQIRQNWLVFDEQRNDKNQALSTIRRSMGYGGMVHNFNNYMLRFNQDYADAVRADIGAAQAGIDFYKTLNISENERQALQQLADVLSKYWLGLQRVSLAISHNKSPEQINSLIVINDTDAVTAFRALELKINKTVPELNVSVHSRSFLLQKIRHHLGYAGFIHHFKRYLFEKSPALHQQAKTDLAQVFAYLEQYHQHTLSDDEQRALADIIAVLKQYEAKLAIAIEMVEAGHTASEIDHIVKVNDAPALAGFEYLQSAMIEQNEHRAQQLYDAIDWLHDAEWLIAILILLIFIAFIGFSIWVFRSLIARPISQLTAIMSRLAKDDLSVNIPFQSQHNEIGEMARSVAVFKTNAMEKKDALAALQQANKQLAQHSEQLEHNTAELNKALAKADAASQAKTEFLSSMSHELRTPMNSVMGFAQLLMMEQDKLDEEQRSYISHILESGEHLMSLINDVLDLSKIESGNVDIARESIKLSGIADQACRWMQSLAEQYSVTLENKITGHETGELTIVADPQKLVQVLLNLLSNGIKYNQRDGKVVIYAARQPSGKVRISVEDSGEGIDEALLDKLFEPFNRLQMENGTIPGTGIGLTISEQLVKKMQGEMGVYSNADTGMTFWIEFDGH